MRLEVGIIALVEEALGVKAEKRAQFDWLCNKPSREHFGDYYDILMELYDELRGDWEGTSAKADGFLTPDAYFPEPYHFIFEFDELQHFTQFREQTFWFYPKDVPLAYAPEKYLKFCQQYRTEALAKGPDRFRRATADFPYINGRAAQRAFFDTFRDWLPPQHGLNPTVRLAEFEVKPILDGELTGDAAKAHIKKLICEQLADSEL
ncbi:hypothetical protein C6501_02580 [Candidatus Poribacteria bacterium]|nr:MAG: hypothetical protein C6501_02580 [Candidatus Poribacteria bacterium]